MGWSTVLLPCLLMGQLLPATPPSSPPAGDRYANEQPAADPAPLTDPAPLEEAGTFDAAPQATTPPATSAPAAAVPLAEDFAQPQANPAPPAEIEPQVDSEAAPPAESEDRGVPAESNPAIEFTAPAKSNGGAEDDSQSLVPVHPPGIEPAAARLLRRALAPPEEDALQGRTIYLADLLTNNQRIGPEMGELLDSYWQLSAALAEYHFALDEHQQLVQSIGAKAPQEPALEAALSAAYARVQSARLAAVEAQHDLAQRMMLPADDNLPLPGDRPLVLAYRTYYDELFGQRSALTTERRQARRIHDTLPLRLQAINAQAAAAEASERLFAEIGKAIEDGRAGEAMLLDRYEKLRGQRRDYMDAVLRYNLAITRYALMVVPDGAVASSLLPMLMKDPPAQSLQATAPPALLEPTPSTPALVAPTPLASPGSNPTPLVPNTAATTPTPAAANALPNTSANNAAPSSPSTGSGVIQATAEEPLAEAGMRPNNPTEPRQLRSVVVPSRSR